MKKIAIMALLFPILALAQSHDRNYIKSTTYKSADTTDANSKSVQIVYFDGLGRPIQQIAHRQSASGKDIVTHIGYDAFGRQEKDYLPYAASTASLNYNPSAESETLSFYGSPNTALTGNPNFEATANPYSQKLFEASPLNRVLQQAAPGDAWKLGGGHEVRMEYQTNAASEARLYKADSQLSAATGLYMPTLSQNGHYGAGQLYKTVTRDENWTSGNAHTVQEFKDKEGRVVLKRAYGESIINGREEDSWHDTYYVYDQYGNLSFVMPPLSDGSMSLDDLDGLCYQYRYDRRNRLAEKKLPGKQWEFITYDRLDRVVATGPASSPYGLGTQGWNISKYDAFGRVAYTGWYAGHLANSAGRKTIQNLLDGAATLWESRNASGTVDNTSIGYTSAAFPASGLVLLSASYYDSYVFPGARALPSSIEQQPLLASPKGMPTGAWTAVLESGGRQGSEISHLYYDSKGRPVGSYLNNHLGGFSNTDTKLDFAGKTLYTLTAHKRSENDDKYDIREEYAYSGQDRLVQHTHQINSGDTHVLASNEYDALGQLIRKHVGGLSGGTALQHVDYAYNIRGWLKEINSMKTLEEGDLFAFRLNYNTVENTINYSGTPLFNGNISETHWHTASDDIIRMYGYSYDALNRIREATYRKPGVPGALKSYDEQASYDKNGNIVSMERNGHLDSDNGTAIGIDKLEYRYEGNQLQAVEDGTNSTDGFADNAGGSLAADDYKYDENGNMVSDLNKNIESISYNHLNLPVQIIMYVNGKKHSIDYIYAASGEKRGKIITDSEGVKTNTDYLQGFQYKQEVLQFFPHAEGYVALVDGKNFQYVYNYADHLGNVRLSYGVDPANGQAMVLEENHYYPFGLKHKNYNAQQFEYAENENGVSVVLEEVLRKEYQYKYNGKELQDELGLNLYDYGARNYDPAIGRWMNMDALAEKATSLTPYRYAFNNPMFFVDPNGNYETDGHYWTVYLAGMLAGRQDAGTLAYYAEAPDNIMSDRGDIMRATNTWAFINWQVDVHAITGGYADEERRISEIKFHNSSSLRDKGFALHRFGDSYAHSKSNGRMYDTGIGHALKGHEPDKIANRPELYLEYAQALTTMLGGSQKDMFTFEYVANNKGTTEQNSAILETEVRLQEGVVKSFSVSGNQVGTINNYMKARNEHTKSSTKYKATSVTGDIYRPDGNGGWNKTTETRTYVTF